MAVWLQKLAIWLQKLATWLQDLLALLRGRTVWFGKFEAMMMRLLNFLRARSPWLEHMADVAYRRFYLLAPLLLLLVATLVISDHELNWVRGMVPEAGMKIFGGGIGKTAFTLGFVATLYYGVRDALVTASRLHVPVPAWLDSFLKYWIKVLRLAHPLLGVLVFSVVSLHGYVMWRIMSAGRFGFAVETGLEAAAILVMVAVSGLFVRWMPKLYKLRHVHRLVGILFVLSFVIHRMVSK